MAHMILFWWGPPINDVMQEGGRVVSTCMTQNRDAYKIGKEGFKNTKHSMVSFMDRPQCDDLRQSVCNYFFKNNGCITVICSSER